MPIDGDDNDNILNDTSGDDEINGFGGNDTITVTAGHDDVDGGTGNDKLVVDYSTSTFNVTTVPVPLTRTFVPAGTNHFAGTFREEGGSALVDFVAIERFEILTGSGNDMIVTGDNADRIVTGIGDDYLHGGGGTDSLEGGAGNDTYVVDGPDVIVEASGDGLDQIYIQSDYTLNAGAHVEALYVQNILGTGRVVTGNELAQEIYGSIGNDTLRGGGGADLLAGGDGGDFYYYTGTETIADTSAGNTVTALANFAAGAALNVWHIVAGDQVTPLTLFGNDTTQDILGNAQDNVLGGGINAIVMHGLAGNDSYYVNNFGDRVFESGGNGTDVVYTSVTYILPSNQEIEILSTASLTGTAAIDLEGNQLNQLIYGNAGANSLNGGLGADTLIGLGGDDTYYLFDGRERVFEDAGQGRDVVYAGVSYVLTAGAHVEILSTASLAGTAAISLVGNELDQLVYGNAGANSLRGGGGVDSLIGLAGDDTYFLTGGEQIIEAAGEGRDVAYAGVTYALGGGAHVEVLSTASLGGTAPIDLTGNELAQEVYGNAGVNSLNGGGGADYLAGLGGADTFAFTTALGGGNVDVVADLISGTDRIALDDAVFTGLAPGALPPGAFVIGSAAGDADDRIVYNSATGQLYFDADGSGAAAQVLFATLNAGQALAASDFVVI